MKIEDLKQILKDYQNSKVTIDEFLAINKQRIIDDLKDLDHGYAKTKRGIAKATNINEAFITILLKELREEKIAGIMNVFSSETWLPNGSGYALSEKNSHLRY